jgi:Tfp pilus assembly protein PilZ
MLHVSAIEPSTGERKKVVVRNYADYAASQKQGDSVPIVIDGGTTKPGTSTVDVKTNMVNGVDDSGDLTASKRKRGFFSGLFSRRRKPAAGAAGAAGAAVAAAAAAADAAAADAAGGAAEAVRAGAVAADTSSADSGSSKPVSPSITLPTNLPVSVEDDAFPEDENTDHGDVAGPAILGMADSSSSSMNDEVQLSELDLQPLEPTPVEVNETQDIQLVQTDQDLFDLSLPDALQSLDAPEVLGEYEELGEDFGFTNINDPNPFSSDSEAGLEGGFEDVLSSESSEDTPSSSEQMLEMDEDPSSEPELFAEEDFSEIDLGDLGFEDFSQYDPESGSGSDVDSAPESAHAPPLDESSPQESEEEVDFGDLEFDLSELNDFLPSDETAEPGHEDLFHTEDLNFGDLDTLFDDASPTEEEQHLLSESLPTAEIEQDPEEITHIQRRADLDDVPSVQPKKRKKPAKLKLAYKDISAMVSEYRENVRRGGCVVKTPSPLPVGRECAITVKAPGLEQPLSLSGTVTWVSTADDQPDQEPSMHIEYQFRDGEREELELLLSRLVN